MRERIRIMLPCLYSFLFSFTCLAQSGVITTYVGPTLPKKDAAATTQIVSPSSIAFDGVGGFYFSSPFQNRIYHIAPDGRSQLAAGNGAPGYGGDGGPAISAQLNFPLGIAIDPTGNLFVADPKNFRIRKITPDGTITTVIGNAKDNQSGSGSQAASVSFLFTDIAVDSTGNLYIVDYGNNRIRRVTPAGVIRTVAGNGKAGYSGDGDQATAAQLSGPYSIAVDSSGNLFISDTKNYRIRKVTLSSR